MDGSLVPNVTQFPNVLTDQIMSLVSGNEWKVIHYGVRYALGHRSSDTLSVAQIAHGRQADDGTWLDRGTGLSEDEVKACLAFLCDEVHIFLREDRPRKPHGYRLNADLSSINWETLNQRVQATLAPLPPIEAAPTPRRRSTAPAARPGRFVEMPASNVVLDGSDRPVVEQLRMALAPDEEQTFSYLLALAEKTAIGPIEDVAWVLYRLWRSYGFRRLQNAFQSPVATSMEEISKSCLVGAVAELLEQEQFGPITQAVRDQLVVLADEWPVLADWDRAIRSAVAYNSRRLATVEKNLKRHTAVPAPESGVRNGGSATPAQGRKRPARRQSEWSAEELRAGQEADRGKEWTPPPS
jgi:hypothetical protein